MTWLLRVDRLPANKACCLRRWAVAFPLPRRLDVPAVRAPEWFGPFRVAVQATCKHWQSRGPRATGSSSSCSGSALAVALATGLAVSILLLVKEPDAGNERVTMPSSFLPLDRRRVGWPTDSFPDRFHVLGTHNWTMLGSVVQRRDGSGRIVEAFLSQAQRMIAMLNHDESSSSTHRP